jgi:hypothetical protein
VGQAHLFDATTGNLLHTFDDPTVTDGDSFGWSVAIDGEYVVIGAPRDDTNGTGAGQTHLFDITTGNLLRTFNDPTVSGIDLFGSSVAIDDNHVLIGAPSNGLDEGNVSQAHLFDALTGGLLQTFNNPTMSGVDQFASSVAIDGNHVLIGADYDDTSGLDVGQAHLFDTTTGNLLQTFGDPTVTERDEFGQSVALDGNHVLIGAYYDDTIGPEVGQAHLFTRVPEPAASALAAISLSLGLAVCRGRKRP